MKKVASLQYGVIFKKAFCQPDIFTGFVRDILGIQVHIEQVETEKSFVPIVGKVNTRFDLFAEDVANRIVVDIQHVRFPDHYDRFLHYHCVALLEQVANAKLYTPKLQVFTIVVLTSADPYHQVDVATIDFDPKDLKGRKLNAIPHRVVYLCPKHLNDDTPEPYREWLQAIDDSLDGEVEETDYQRPEIRRVFDLIEEDLVSPDERARMFDEYAMELVKQDKYREGLKEGRAEGHTEAMHNNIRNMLKAGLEVSLIATITGMSVEEIQSLQLTKD